MKKRNLKNNNKDNCINIDENNVYYGQKISFDLSIVLYQLKYIVKYYIFLERVCLCQKK